MSKTKTEETFEGLEEILKAPQLNLKYWKDEALNLIHATRDDFHQKKTDEKLAHQLKKIVEIWTASRFKDRSMVKTRHDISYRKAQITAIGEMIANRESRRIAKKLAEWSGIFNELLGALALGLLKAI